MEFLKTFWWTFLTNNIEIFTNILKDQLKKLWNFCWKIFWAIRQILKNYLKDLWLISLPYCERMSNILPFGQVWNIELHNTCVGDGRT